MSAIEPTIWQAVPTKELTRIADELSEIADLTEGVLHTSLSQALSNQIIMLRYHVEQAEYYNEAAAEQPEIKHIYAAPYDTVEGFPFVADAWYFQRKNQWMAVVREWEPEADWFEDDCYALDAGDTPNWPTPRTYPITERPPAGDKLIYRLSDGTEVSEIA